MVKTLARTALVAVGAVGILAATNRTAEAQTAPSQNPGWEFLVHNGTIVPTGAERETIKRGNLTAAQLSYVPRPALAITGTLGWARSRDIGSVGNPKLDVFTYDVGAELRAARWIDAKAMTFTPFAGVGAGGRSYNYRNLDVNATHNAAAYGSVGGELGVRRIRLRVEARDYVTGFKPLAGEGAANTRSDIVVMAGLRFVRR